MAKKIQAYNRGAGRANDRRLVVYMSPTLLQHLQAAANGRYSGWSLSAIGADLLSKALGNDASQTTH